MKREEALPKLIFYNLKRFFYRIKNNIASNYSKFIDRIGINVQNVEDVEYKDLAPVDEIENGKEYFKALDWALQNEKVTNIALTGPYGSGKSSVIKAYKKKHPSLKSVNISLASFLEVKIDENGSNTEELIIFDEDKIEEGILKQLFYKVNYKKIPHSRYRKLHNVSGIRIFRNLFLLGVLILFCTMFFLPNVFDKFKSTVFESGNNFGFSNIIAIIVSGILIVAVIGVVSYLFWWISTKYKLKEFNLSDKASILADNEDDKSIFNKNMDEIVYFFEATDFDIVFIEDLDRFKSMEIFIKLREINTILNNYEMIKRKIVFIYAIKDDMFTSIERTKFFDIIIPIIPIINSTNSGEILLKKLQKKSDNESNKIEYKYNISTNYVTLVSPYIEDMRVLINTYNEFAIYKNTLGINQELNLIDEKMMSLMIFKNLYPKDFADLQSECGIVKQAFLDKKAYIDNKLKQYNSENNNLKLALENIEIDVLSDVKELKAALMYHLSKGQGTVRYIMIGGNRYDFTTIMDDNFDMNKLKNTRFSVSYFDVHSNHYSEYIIENIDNILKKQNRNGKGFIERCEYLKNSSTERKNELMDRIEKLNNQITFIKTYSLERLIKEYSADEILSESVRKNKLLVFLLRNGYIDETYSNYMNYFHPNSITKDEMNFILSVRNYESLNDFSYPLINCERIVERLVDYEFKQVEVLNFSLLDFLLEKYPDIDKSTHFLNQLSNRTSISKEFIKQYIENGAQISVFIRLMAKYNVSLWLDIYDDSMLTYTKKYEYFIIIMRYADIEDIERLNLIYNEETKIELPVASFILENKDILKRLDSVDDLKIKKLIEYLGICFYELECEGVSNELLEYIFGNNYYKINMQMLQNLILWKQPELVTDLSLANYTVIRKLEYKPLLDYIEMNFSEYVEKIVINLDNNEHETIETVLCIINKLIDTPDICNKVIKKENVILQSFEECCIEIIDKSPEMKENIKSVWNQFLHLNKIDLTWNNVIIYWKQFGLLNELLKFIERNMEMLLQAEDFEIITDDFIKSVIIEQMEIEKYKKFITKFRVNEFTNQLSEFTEEQLRVMLENSYFELIPERLNEMRSCNPELCLEYIVQNKDTFLDNIDEYEVNILEIEGLVDSNMFTDSELLKVIRAQEINEMSRKIALSIGYMKNEVDKDLVEQAWNVLTGKDRCELLINHIDVYNLEELEEKFVELGNEYLQLTNRSKRHKVTLTNTEFNQRLMNLLHSIGYLSSISTKPTYDGYTDKISYTNNITGWVREA